jgi:hypothetical protein
VVDVECCGGCWIFWWTLDFVVVGVVVVVNGLVVVDVLLIIYISSFVFHRLCLILPFCATSGVNGGVSYLDDTFTLVFTLPEPAAVGSLTLR